MLAWSALRFIYFAFTRTHAWAPGGSMRHKVHPNRGRVDTQHEAEFIQSSTPLLVELASVELSIPRFKFNQIPVHSPLLLRLVYLNIHTAWAPEAPLDGDFIYPILNLKHQFIQTSPPPFLKSILHGYEDLNGPKEAQLRTVLQYGYPLLYMKHKLIQNAPLLLKSILDGYEDSSGLQEVQLSTAPPHGCPDTLHESQVHPEVPASPHRSRMFLQPLVMLYACSFRVFQFMSTCDM
ncbi:hypothetical protein BJ508DRAFT_375711 [Ascobolus immersus RN42]|uniref:Uncharacterized protein n=1 Tax=Ascobolus immersus RN42 TaxID=1160509 RepID=A0A3N4IAG0_ASCIM|nr:hypothetical protein BJ508DRAFT_375711 [Ascobolus immersus RN42]